MGDVEINHSYYLNIIRRVLRASYVSWVTKNGVKSLKVVINKQEHMLPFEGEITHETYSQLIKDILKPIEEDAREHVQEPV